MAVEHYGKALLAFWKYSTARHDADIVTSNRIQSKVGTLGNRRRVAREIRKAGGKVKLRDLKAYSRAPKSAKQASVEQIITKALPQVRATPQWKMEFESMEYHIDGIIDSGDRVEDRVWNEIYGQQGEWSRIRTAFIDGSISAQKAGEWFIEDVFSAQYYTSEFDLPGTEYSCHSTQQKRNW